MHNLNNV
jgi:ankyrin repeat protein